MNKMELKIERQGEASLVYIAGQCCFSDYGEFQRIIEMVEEKASSTLILLLPDLYYIDSSGLGMLLVLRDKCQGTGINLVLRHPTGQVRKMLEVAQLNEIFTIEY